MAQKGCFTNYFSDKEGHSWDVNLIPQMKNSFCIRNKRLSMRGLYSLFKILKSKDVLISFVSLLLKKKKKVKLKTLPNRLPKEVMDAPFLEVLKVKLDESLDSLIWWKVFCLGQEGWTRWSWKVPSYPNHSDFYSANICVIFFKKVVNSCSAYALKISINRNETVTSSNFKSWKHF